MLRQLLTLVEPHFEPNTWKAFCRVALEGLRADVVAQEMGISKNAVIVAKSRVLSRLRQELRGLSNLLPVFSARAEMFGGDRVLISIHAIIGLATELCGLPPESICTTMATHETSSTMSNTTSHPSRQQLSAYSLGQLPPAEATTIESHIISECEPCCDTIISLSFRRYVCRTTARSAAVSCRSEPWIKTARARSHLFSRRLSS